MYEGVGCSNSIFSHIFPSSFIITCIATNSSHRSYCCLMLKASPVVRVFGSINICIGIYNLYIIALVSVSFTTKQNVYISNNTYLSRFFNSCFHNYLSFFGVSFVSAGLYALPQCL